MKLSVEKIRHTVSSDQFYVTKITQVWSCLFAIPIAARQMQASFVVMQ